jgi:putative membrane protein
MYINKTFSVKGIWRFSGHHFIWITLWTVFVTCGIEFMHSFDIYGLQVPMLPVTIIGTAVAFYVGFKNNSAYDRLWEARKIWGAIVNSSRMWGTTVKGFVGNLHNENPASETEILNWHRKLIYRHIAWLYTLRTQLLVPTPWEHISQGKMIKNHAKKLMKYNGADLFLDEVTEATINNCVLKEEMDKLLAFQNTATQLIDKQTQELKELREKNLIDDFRHMELQKLLNDFYTHQGKAERIKKFPLPRQYGNMSILFVGIFIFLLPFGFVTAFHDLGDWGAWLSMPFSILVGWVYVMMELIGDYSENPFEGLGNDIPMLSLCRTIEIDLKEMLGETNLPKPIEAKNGVLM